MSEPSVGVVLFLSMSSLSSLLLLPCSMLRGSKRRRRCCRCRGCLRDLCLFRRRFCLSRSPR